MIFEKTRSKISDVDKEYKQRGHPNTRIKKCTVVLTSPWNDRRSCHRQGARAPFPALCAECQRDAQGQKNMLLGRQDSVASTEDGESGWKLGKRKRYTTTGGQPCNALRTSRRPAPKRPLALGGGAQHRCVHPGNPPGPGEFQKARWSVHQEMSSIEKLSERASHYLHGAHELQVAVRTKMDLQNDSAKIDTNARVHCWHSSTASLSRGVLAGGVVTYRKFGDESIRPKCCAANRAWLSLLCQWMLTS